MLDPVEQFLGVLDHGLIDLELDLDRSAVDVVRIGTSVRRCLRELAFFALALVLTDDRLEANPLLFESTSQPLER